MKKLGCLLVGVIAVGVLIVAGSRVLTSLKRDLKPERRDVLLTSVVYDAERFRMARPILEEMVPPAASNIELRLAWTCGGIMGGPKDEIGGLGCGAELRCEVTQEGLAEFAKANKYTFQSESITKNFCTEKGAVADGCDWIGDVYERYNGNCDYPKKFLSYNFIYPSCAGFSFFYDVEKAVLYARWGSN